MAEMPPELLTRDRSVDPDFADEELLYRRFHPSHLDGAEIAIDAVELPDMSVNRSKYSRPEWVIWDEAFEGWGVLAFRVRDIPPDRIVWHAGVIPYTLEPRHMPLKYNYPHTEVWVFRDGIHIIQGTSVQPGNLQLLDPDFHLRWRECIVLASHIAVYPSEDESN